MDKWEYMQLKISMSVTLLDVDNLNKLGEQGWELVTVVSDVHSLGAGSSTESEAVAVLKRRKP